MRFMLDTSICIYAMKHRPPEVLTQLRAHAAAGLGISSITAGELHFGVAKTGSVRNQAALRQFLEPLETADFGAQAAENYGRLRATLEQAGTPIGPLDTQIAAHALALDVTLVSHNLREFARVPGLRLVSWVSTPA
ncbi:MAG TPA: type II toxin-antitoxin system VapC family toxin [Aquabacterium sp.]|nr:type II toxin-antitoxin system VapC family toxin [Aquabacterium sp.]HQC97792.1 type II toxin-antitoxin system VapC family toxin [Aquabacterium sp.]